MIYDILQNSKKYNLSGLIHKAFEHSRTLPPDRAPGVTHLIDDDLILIINSYETEDYLKCNVETHNNYIDLQIMLEGMEYAMWYPQGSLPVRESYNKEKDCTFYHAEAKGETFLLTPERFVLFYPWDIHASQIMINTSQKVKKAVYKIRAGI